jgi:hypothetical protein
MLQEIEEKEDKIKENVEDEPREIDSDQFLNSAFTIDDALKEIHKDIIRYKETYISLLASCIAITSRGDFIVKERNEDIGMIEYNVKDRRTLVDQLYINCTYKVTEYEMKQMKKKKKKVEEFKNINLSTIISAQEFRKNCQSFNDVGLIGNDDTVFGLRRPPHRFLYLNKKIKYKPELAKRFIEFVANRINNPEAWFDLLDTVKYQILNPCSKAVRFYICFEKDGDAGKSFAIQNLSKMFGNFSMDNIAPSAMKDQFNSWIENYLYIGFEEAENDNYTDKEVNTWVKRSTSIKTSIRGMRAVNRGGKFYAIPVMNSNDPGLYGLTRSDKATKRRIVIMMFKPADKNIDWSAEKTIVGDISFDYSLYKYMYDEYKISKDYDPTSYNDNYNVWSKLQTMKPVPIESFNEFLKMYSNEIRKPSDINYKLVHTYLSKTGKFQFYYLYYHEVVGEFMKYLQKYHKKSIGMTPETFKKGMLELGWEYDRKKSIYNKQTPVLFRTEFEEEPQNDDDVYFSDSNEQKEEVKEEEVNYEQKDEQKEEVKEVKLESEQKVNDEETEYQFDWDSD